MIIGTVRKEEARVFDQFAGYHSFHAEETQESYGSLEIFWHKGGPLEESNPPTHDDWDCDDSEQCEPAGWYWRSCFPGCLPDGDSFGPFASSRQALEDADPWNPEFDE